MSLKFGVIAEGDVLQAWQVRCVKSLLETDDIQLSLIVIMNDPSKTAAGPGSRVAKSWGGWLDRSTAHKKQPIPSEMRQAPVLDVSVDSEMRDHPIWSSRHVTNAIQQLALDFILDFSDSGLDCQRSDIAKYGIWQFHHGKYDGPFACFEEIVHGDRTTRLRLYQLGQEPAKRILLREGFLKTIDTSCRLNRDQALWEGSGWPRQVCIDLVNETADFPLVDTETDSSAGRDGETSLGGRYFWRKLSNSVSRLNRYLLTYDQWNLGIADGPIHQFLETGSKPEIRWLPLPPPNHFRADPFGIERNGDLFMFYEDFEYRRGSGEIACAAITNGATGDAIPVIKSPGHLSYPYLVVDNNKVYCVPEACDTGEIAVFESIDFPRHWRKAATLVPNVAGVDPTVFYDRGIWWMAATDQDDGPDHKLRLWYANQLLGPWKSHANNPVKVDIRSSRPAGTPFQHEGQLYRPAQDCSDGYGRRINLCRILKLTPFEFKEEVVEVINPDEAYGDGIHTICGVGNLTLVDGKRQLSALKSLAVLRSNFQFVFSRMLGDTRKSGAR